MWLLSFITMTVAAAIAGIGALIAKHDRKQFEKYCDLVRKRNNIDFLSDEDRERYKKMTKGSFSS
jgi:hypothetical protein